MGAVPLIKLELAWMPFQNDNIQIWSCLPGFLPATGGKWTEHVLVDWGLQFYDYEGNLLAHAAKMNVDWTGYPLDSLEGAIGPFQVMRPGGTLDRFTQWKMVSV